MENRIYNNVVYTGDKNALKLAQDLFFELRANDIQYKFYDEDF